MVSITLPPSLMILPCEVALVLLGQSKWYASLPRIRIMMSPGIERLRSSRWLKSDVPCEVHGVLSIARSF